MESKYTVVGDFRHPHKDCEGDTLTDLSYAEAVRIESEWKKEKNTRMFSVSNKTKYGFMEHYKMKFMGEICMKMYECTNSFKTVFSRKSQNV